MAAKRKYFFFVNLGFLGFAVFAYFFDIAFGKENLIENLTVDTYKNPPVEKLKGEQKENIFLTLKIFSDK